MTASKTQFLEVDGGRVAYDDTGAPGRLVIALPGMGDLRSEYRFLRPILQRAGYRVVTVDVRGFGETSAVWKDYSAHAVARDVLALIRHLNAGPAVVLGNSFAAGSALWAAQDAPKEVSGAILLGPIVRDIPVPWYATTALKMGFGGPWRVWFWTTYWESLFPTKKPADIAEVKAAITKNMHEPGRVDALKTMLFLPKTDTQSILETVKIPSLIVMGTRDPDFTDPAAEAHLLAEKLKTEDVVIVEGAGHYPHTEMCDQISGDILNFLAKVHQ